MPPTRREAWLVIDFDDPAKMAEFMVIIAWKLGSYPTFTPVILGSEFGKVVTEALEAVKKAP